MRLSKVQRQIQQAKVIKERRKYVVHAYCNGKSTKREGTEKVNVYSLSALQSHSQVRILLCIGSLPPGVDLSHLPAEMLLFILLLPELP